MKEKDGETELLEKETEMLKLAPPPRALKTREKERTRENANAIWLISSPFL